MKLLHTTLLTLITGVLLSTGASAAVNYTGNGTQLYTGIKAGQFDISTDKVDFENPMAFGLYAGVNLNKTFGAEAEYLTSTDTSYIDGLAGEYTASTMGVYGTYKLDLMNGLYAKSKLGYAQTSLILNDDDDNKVDNAGIAGGFGLGLNVTPNISIEGEYIKLPSIDVLNTSVDANLMTIGANFKF